MPVVPANGIELYHETFGDPGHPPVLLISGLGAQCTGFDDRFVDALVATDLFVTRYDNRDVGLSTHLEPGVEYGIGDLVGDALALLDVLELERAHVVGTSMGGMIAQQLAIDAPERVLSLTSVMSSTGEAEVGNPSPEILGALIELQQPVEGREAAIEKGMSLARLIGSPDFDEDYHRTRQTSFYDRCYDPGGVARQFMAVMGAPDRAAGLAALDGPVRGRARHRRPAHRFQRRSAHGRAGTGRTVGRGGGDGPRPPAAALAAAGRTDRRPGRRREREDLTWDRCTE